MYVIGIWIFLNILGFMFKYSVCFLFVIFFLKLVEIRKI